MPSKTKPQQNLMRAAAHTPGGYGGVPQSVGRDYVNADKKLGVRFQAGGVMGRQPGEFAMGGPPLGRTGVAGSKKYG